MSLDIGDIALNRYRLTRILGEGGMGRVYLAEHTRLGTRVALKVLLQHETPDLRERFESEAKLMAQVHHPNTVAVLDYGHTADGCPILAMEFVEGESLGDILDREGPQDWSIVTPMIEQALDGLEAAHGLGIVHRDIKPANILVSLKPPRSVKLADFGIAKRSADPKQTTTGFIIGTPDYMAPEVMAGKQASVISDVYSMATTLFELVSGHVPFEGSEALARFQRDAPALVAPNHRSAVPSELADVVARCLSRVASERLRSADELAEALRRIARSRKANRPGTPSAPADAMAVAKRANRPTEGFDDRAVLEGADTGVAQAQGPAPAAMPSIASPADVDRALPEDPSLDEPPASAVTAPNAAFLLVAALPASRLALVEERRYLAALVGSSGRGYSLGAGLWFAVFPGEGAQGRAAALREQVAARYGGLMRALIAEAPPDFRLSTSQLAGASPLPAPLPELINKVTQ